MADYTFNIAVVGDNREKTSFIKSLSHEYIHTECATNSTSTIYSVFVNFNSKAVCLKLLDIPGPLLNHGEHEYDCADGVLIFYPFRRNNKRTKILVEKCIEKIRKVRGIDIPIIECCDKSEFVSSRFPIYNLSEYTLTQNYTNSMSEYFVSSCNHSLYKPLIDIAKKLLNIKYNNFWKTISNVPPVTRLQMYLLEKYPAPPSDLNIGWL